MLDALFQPFNLGQIELRNRIVMPPMITLLASESGAVTQRMIDYYSERAKGGVGLIIIESAYALEADRDFGRLGIGNPQLQVGLSELVESIQEWGARVFLQINHRGSLLSIHKGKGPDELTLEEMETITESFSLAALRAKKAGFDGVEIHGANVYLIAQFLSPLTNHRQDKYGGGLEGRMKFLMDVFLRIRQKVGAEYPVTLRMAGHEHTEGGLQLTDTQFIAQRMAEAGVNGLHISAGSPVVPYWHVPPMAVPRGCHVHLAAAIKKVAKIPVIAVGRINDPLLANEIVAEGKADLVAMGRALIADPYLPWKTREGRLEEIRKCLACNYCRKRVVQMNRTLRCAVNAAAGRERDSRIAPSPKPQKIMVVGGGPAGMETARVLALRGHQVVLYEKGPRLGGQVNLAVIPPHKEELRNIVDYLTFQMENLNVEVHLGRAATAETVAKESPDAIIVATGALPLLPEIPGLERERLFTPEEALKEDRPMAEKIIVIGGGMVGCELAEYLASKRKQVIIIEKLAEVASGMEGHTRRLLLERLDRLSVQIITEAEVLSLQGKNALLRKTGKTIEVETEGIVVAMGGQVDRTCAEFKSCGLPFYTVGDCAEVRDLAAAIQEGFRAALEF